MTSDEDLREARAAEARASQMILKLASEIRSVLAEDFVDFPVYEVRRRFISDAGQASRMSDEDVARLKAAIGSRAVKVRDEILAAMEDPEPWLSAADIQSPGKSLSDNPRLWALTQPMVKMVSQILDSFGFVQVDEIEYRMPMRFIRKKFVPGLAEKYWALVSDLCDARNRVREAEASKLRDALGKRWDGL
jgi:hypothetical protein